MTYYHLPPFIYTKNHFFQSHKMSFSALVASIGQQVLTKRSTNVDQNVRSDKVMSQLFLAIFVTFRTHLVVQKSLIYEKSPKMDESMQPTRYFIKKRVKMVDFVLTFFFHLLILRIRCGIWYNAIYKNLSDTSKHVLNLFRTFLNQY